MEVRFLHRKLIRDSLIGRTKGFEPLNLGSNPSLEIQMKTFDKVKQFYEEGFSGTEIARKLNLSKPTVCWHLSKIRKPKENKTKFPWADIIDSEFTVLASVTCL